MDDGRIILQQAPHTPRIGKLHAGFGCGSEIDPFHRLTPDHVDGYRVTEGTAGVDLI